MNDYIDAASRDVRIQEGTRALEQILLECYLTPGISTKELARRAMLPIPVTAAAKKAFIKLGALQQERGVKCTSAGRLFIEQQWGYAQLNQTLYQQLMSGKEDWRSLLRELLAQLEALFLLRPQVDVQLDQAKCTPETSLRRAILCLQDHSLIGKQILCVGDDDMVSVSLGMLLKHLFPKGGLKTNIQVVDLDVRYLSYIKEIAQQEGLPITCHHLDLRHPLPEPLQGEFDCVFTDPPYTLQGMSLFISRGIMALKKIKGLPLFLSFAHKSPEFTLAMQREFVQMGLVAKAVIPHFNEYEGAEIIGNKSQMLVLKTTEQTVPDITDYFTDMLYTGEVKRTIRTYCCKGCGRQVLVGLQGEIATIEELKNTGCSDCGNRKFELVVKSSVSHD